MNKSSQPVNLRQITRAIIFWSLIFSGLLIAINCRATENIKVSVNEIDLQGNWTGESICQVQNSPCHDEKVIYRITEPDAAGKLTVQMDKIVDGKPEIMVTLDCTHDQTAKTLVCEMKNGVWKFSITGNKMEGTLTLPDKTLYRRISVSKVK